MLITDQQLGSVNYSTPRLIIVSVTPSPSARSSNSLVVGLVTQTTRGATNKLHSVSSLNEFERKCGGYDAALGTEGYLTVKDFFDSNGSNLKIARAASTGTVAATATLFGDPSGTTEIGTFTLDSVGTWGNSVKADVNAASVDDYVNIVVRNTATQESRTYVKTTTDINDDRYIGKLVAKDAMKFFTYTAVITDGSVLPDVGTTSFAGGSNGTDVGDDLADTAYVGVSSGGTNTGLQMFKSQNADDVSIVISSRSTDTINAGIIVHVNDIKLSPRRARLCFAIGTTADEVIDTKMATMDYEKVSFSWPHVQVSNPFTGELEVHNTSVFDAANDTLIGYWQSASQTKYPATVVDTEIDIQIEDIDRLTAKRVNPIKLEIGSGFLRASDYTSSSNPALSQNIVCKAKHFYARAFYKILQPFLSLPITPTLWTNMRNALIGLLKIEAAAIHIGRSDGGIPYGVKIDRENNPQEIVQMNKVIALVEIALLAPADIIVVFLDAQQDKTIVNA